MSTTDHHQDVCSHLHAALDHLLAALVRAEGLPNVPLLDEALDAALAGDPALKEVRTRFQEALRSLQGAEGDDDRLRLILALEEAVNALGARCAEVGFRVGAAMNPATQEGPR